MWVILKVKATRHPCYSADFLHADNRGSEGEHSPSVGEKTEQDRQCTYNVTLEARSRNRYLMNGAIFGKRLLNIKRVF
jgi:hypothetical protein